MKGELQIARTYRLALKDCAERKELVVDAYELVRQEFGQPGAAGSDIPRSDPPAPPAALRR